ncbi:MAG: hypothetical protein WCO69_00060 [Candidatus Omnitrophota bacterium]
MLKNIRNKKAQNTAEYAILIALVIGGVVAMQTYAQRALQARVRDTSKYMATSSGNDVGIGTTLQYEPYYSNSTEKTDKVSSDVNRKSGSSVTGEVSTNTNKRDQVDRVEYSNTDQSGW